MKKVLGFVVFVNRSCESEGDSHAVVGHESAKPLLLCGADSQNLNWTLNPKPPTRLCSSCDRKTRAGSKEPLLSKDSFV